MTFELLLALGAIAAVDALNPTTIVGCAYLLSTPAPARRTMAFIAGVFTMYFGAGAALLLLLGDRTSELLDHLQGGLARAAVEVVIGLSMVVLAAHQWRRRKAQVVSGATARRPRSLSAAGAFGFGFVVTLADAPTAFPYLGALGLIARADVGHVAELATLLAYNVIFVAPAIALLGGWRVSGQRGVAALERLRLRVTGWFADPSWAVTLAVVGTLIAVRPLLAAG